MDDVEKPKSGFATGTGAGPTPPSKPPEAPPEPPKAKEEVPRAKITSVPPGPKKLTDEERLDYMFRFFITKIKGTCILNIPGCPPIQAKTPREAVDKAAHTFRNR